MSSKNNLKALPNCITALRIIFSLVIILVQLFSWQFYVLYTLCGLTDVLDGFIARKYALTSDLGAKLDSIADFVSIAVTLCKLVPVVIALKLVLIATIVIAIIKLISFAVALKRFKTFASIHTYLNKLTGLMLFALPFVIKIIGLNISCGVIVMLAFVAAIEELIIMAKSKTLNLNAKGIFIK